MALVSRSRIQPNLVTYIAFAGGIKIFVIFKRTLGELRTRERPLSFCIPAFSSFPCLPPGIFHRIVQVQKKYVGENMKVHYIHYMFFNSSLLGNPAFDVLLFLFPT